MFAEMSVIRDNPDTGHVGYMEELATSVEMDQHPNQTKKEGDETNTPDNSAVEKSECG